MRKCRTAGERARGANDTKVAAGGAVITHEVYAHTRAIIACDTTGPYANTQYQNPIDVREVHDACATDFFSLKGA